MSNSFLSKYFEKGELKILLFILAVAFLLRLLYILEIQDTFFLSYLTDDSKIYNDWAIKMAQDGKWTMNSPFFMAPAYPFFLRIIYGIFGKTLFLVQLLQVIANIATIVFTYLAVRNFSNKKAAIVAAIISAFYTNYIFYSGAILSETLQTFIYSILIYYLTINKKKRSKNYFFYLGLLLGFAAWFRGNILVFAILYSLFVLYKFLKYASIRHKLIKDLGMFYAGLILIIVPITIHNIAAGDDFVLLTSNGGINFFIGNNERAVGVFVTPKEFDFNNDLSGHHYVEEILKKRLKFSEASTYWYNRGLEYIKKHPGDYLLLELKKLILFFGEGEYPQSSNMNPEYFAKHYSRILDLPLFGFFFLVFFAVPGIYLSWKKGRKNILLLMFLISFIFGTILFFVNGRYRMAITPLMVLFAAYGIVEIFNLINDRKFELLKVPAVVLAVFFISYYFLIDRPSFTPYDALLHQGNKAYEDEHFEKAIEYYKKSLFYRDYYMTYVNLGNSYARLKDFRNAVRAYNLAIRRKPDYYLSHFNLGFAYTQMNKWDKAIEEYKITLKYRPDFADAYRNMGIVYYVNEKYEDALFYFRKFMSLSDDEETKANVQKDIETINQKLKSLEEK